LGEAEGNYHQVRRCYASSDVTKSTTIYLRNWRKRPVHFWPFDGWEVAEGKVGHRIGLPGTMSGCPVVSVLEAGHCIRLLAFSPLDNVELDFVTFFERFVPVRVNR
jgi:hypothetical protein